ncbi:hypothetical protein [Amycolatopsis regifaucium]|uniref:Uncharacterized protein n=1 Tax=Amycolatopsis regifaucium TaxID=546365 RepID=A0A154MST4_9PSEU|nr:hypothetical protein [Amycolatopsis regifaucium]KZB86549.1 hypothetical protein AVL48_26265 [Amycolatopsis regifaucium]OKA03494.1 hypothetical protein ATP06_0235910 [Amycolatopsis regifaucium]SFJ15300.1 hypothetical protein SAMN04489731_11660 [Amycolatopsis regifaucium]
MQPHQANPPHGQPQQGYPPPSYPQQFGAPVRLRANPVASILAGLLALLTAGLLVWFAVANILVNNFPEPWPSGVWINVVGGFCSAGLLVVLAVFTFLRTVAGAWTLGAINVFFVIMNLVFSPLAHGVSFGSQLDFVFGFHKATGIAVGLTTIFGTLTAIIAFVAAIARRP